MLWWLAGDARIAGAAPAIEDTRTRVLLSPVCVWECAIKAALGKLRVPDDLLARLEEFDFEPLPVTAAHAWRVRDLPAIHSDPFDRLLAAQAICEGASIVSADTIFDAYELTRVW
jgi:PIN domain nuclease of toxin-antitoxin system